jgi:hypothetical protein
MQNFASFNNFMSFFLKKYAANNSYRAFSNLKSKQKTAKLTKVSKNNFHFSVRRGGKIQNKVFQHGSVALQSLK